MVHLLDINFIVMESDLIHPAPDKRKKTDGWIIKRSSVLCSVNLIQAMHAPCNFDKPAH